MSLSPSFSRNLTCYVERSFRLSAAEQCEEIRLTLDQAVTHALTRAQVWTTNVSSSHEFSTISLFPQAYLGVETTTGLLQSVNVILTGVEASTQPMTNLLAVREVVTSACVLTCVV